MLDRIFLLFVAVSAFVMGVTSFYAHSWLGSIGDPTIASDGFVYHSTFSWTFLWVSFAVLAVFSMVLKWKADTKWPVILTFAYFVVYSVILLYNDTAYAGFISENALTAPYTLLNPFYLAVMLLVMGIALVAAFLMTGTVRVKFLGKTDDRSESPPPGRDESTDTHE